MRLDVEMTGGVAVWVDGGRWTVDCGGGGLPQSTHGSVLSHLRSTVPELPGTIIIHTLCVAHGVQ